MKPSAADQPENHGTGYGPTPQIDACQLSDGSNTVEGLMLVHLGEISGLGAGAVDDSRSK